MLPSWLSITPNAQSQRAHARSGAALTIGVVGRCLSKSMVEGKPLNTQCKALVMAAAPKDVRTYYSLDASSLFMQTVDRVQDVTGVGFVDDQSDVTVSGWLALACIISIIVVRLPACLSASFSCLHTKNETGCNCSSCREVFLSRKNLIGLSLHAGKGRVEVEDCCQQNCC